MTKEKRLLPTIAFVTTFILLIVFLFGQCLIVGMFGPNGSYIKLGLNGYPDYIGLMQVAGSNTPNIAAIDKTSADNLDALTYHIRNEVSLVKYTSQQTTEMLALFATGTLDFMPSLGINHATLTGGYLASIMQWGIDNSEEIFDFTSSSVYAVDYNYKVEGISIQQKGTSAHLKCTVSMYKTYLTSLLSDTTNAAMQFIETTIKTDKAYFTLDFVLPIDSGEVTKVQDLSVSINDASMGASLKMVEYINTKSNKVFNVISTHILSVVKTLGSVVAVDNTLVITNR
ncbi:MAG: hypothetical protein J6V40_01195 [Clostridia bacterium]|nr:hypothetical protein [Clostridia bacterium]